MTYKDQGESRIFSCRFCGKRNRIWPGKVADAPHKAICGGCSEPIFLSEAAPLTGIASSAYEHPLDRRALSLLRRVPGVQTVLRFLLKELSERRLRMLFQQAHVKATPHHLEPLYRMVEHGCRVLDLPAVPDLFVANEPAPNAYAIGVDEPFVVVTTALLDLLDEQQIAGVIAHELGHIHAEHQLYRTALYMIVNFADRSLGGMVPLRDAALAAVYYGLMHWNRCSELTADRAQMLIMRDFGGFVGCEMKLAGGSRYTNGMLDTEAFLQQAQEAVQMQDEHVLNKFYAVLQAADSTHPYPVWRVGHMRNWVYEGEFLEIMTGKYPLRGADEVDSLDADDEEPSRSVPQAVKDLLGQWRSGF